MLKTLPFSLTLMSLLIHVFNLPLLLVNYNYPILAPLTKTLHHDAYAHRYNRR
jgi:hypothetical protein